jgi:hypothetical protein
MLADGPKYKRYSQHLARAIDMSIVKVIRGKPLDIAMPAGVYNGYVKAQYNSIGAVRPRCGGGPRETQVPAARERGGEIGNGLLPISIW